MKAPSKLNSKLLITYSAAGSILLLAVGLYAGTSLRQTRFQVVHESLAAQLYQVDFALTTFLNEVAYDVEDLVENPIVRTRDDARFTSFLKADEDTFSYDIEPTEQAIIDLLNTYRLSHPYVYSVYMGRENGSFVRSHERTRPTRYDPRQRPWYQLALTDPSRVHRTPPTRAVTSDNVSIAIAKALVDEEDQVFGVVGVNINLHDLTNFVASIPIGEGGSLILLDEQGIVLASPDDEDRFKTFEEAGLDAFRAVMEEPEGFLTYRDAGTSNYLFHYTSPELGWRICAVMPTRAIDRQVWGFVIRVLVLIGLSLALLCLLTVVGLQALIIRPVEQLERSAQQIIHTGDLEQEIEVRSRDEVGQLADAFNKMLISIRRANQVLSESEAQYRTLVDNLKIGVFRTAPDGRVLQVNPAGREILGFSTQEDIQGRSLVPFYDEPEARASMLTELQETGIVRNYERRIQRIDGRPIWISSQLIAQFDQAGSLLWIDGLVEDITARKEAEESLRRARDELEQRVAARTADLQARNAELDAFAHTVAHDLKSPVSTLLGYVEILSEEGGGMPLDRLERYVAAIGRLSRKLGGIVDSLLVLSTVRSSEEAPALPLAMGPILAEVRRRVEPLIQELGARMVEPDRWPVALGYAPWVEEVWVNYVTNALKYGGCPPRVELGADLLTGNPGDQALMVRFWVRDNGAGLSPEEQEHLFTPFERLHQVRIAGYGLGLSIVQRIVHKLGGEVGVESSKGQGSVFYFTLSAAAPDPRA